MQEPHGGLIPPVLPQPLSGVQPHGQSGVLDSILPNPIPGMPVTSVQNMLDISLHRRSGLPPLPPGPPPLSSQPLTASQSNCSATSQSSVSGFSGLISSLMAQGLISLTPSAQSQVYQFGIHFQLSMNKSVIFCSQFLVLCFRILWALSLMPNFLRYAMNLQ